MNQEPEGASINSVTSVLNDMESFPSESKEMIYQYDNTEWGNVKHRILFFGYDKILFAAFLFVCGKIQKMFSLISKLI